ncbi:MAG: hypothetical protein M3Y56_10150 [Armatimonadota bacterium]|nr:hypothetical protein [Armatimonadota bacterium]
MPETDDPITLSDWYELISGLDLEQGDILERCPVFQPPADMRIIGASESPAEELTNEVTFVVQPLDVVILSQSCDLVADQKQDSRIVILCPIWTLSAIGSTNQIFNSNYWREMCRRGHMAGYHMVAGCSDERWQREVSIISFREVWSLPLPFVREYADRLGRRPRLRSPYKEHLAQAFARYFMRVGLPTDIPRFVTSKNEEDLMRRLDALDSETRGRILGYYERGSPD